MPSLKNKTCTKLSMIFLICSLLLIMVMMVSWFKDFHGFVPLIHLPEVSAAFIYYPCCLLSGLGLIFSTGAHSKILKRLIAFIHFSCVYGVFLLLSGFVGIERFDLLLAILGYLLLSIWLLKRTNQKWVAIICLGLPMIISTGFFIKINYNLLTAMVGGEMIGYVILLTLSGLVGFILSATLPNKSRRAKWFLLGFNYFFAAYFHIVFLLVLVFDLF